MNKKVEFTGSQNNKIAARLDMPEGTVRAFALFAHCFTCSKDIFAAARIARELTLHSIAVLRFDFTGLGSSEGEFSNTDFSSNIEDLVAAADFLRKNHQAPQLLIGHSLGGAAVLAAAGEIPESKAVVTIGAPADVAHVLQNFHCSLEEIEKQGKATVSLAGRKFQIRSKFVKDAREQKLHERIAHLKKALLIFHSPIDETVGIENAEKIFVAAKHPKSFISLDHSDHLLTRHEDAVFVADMVAVWSKRYIEMQQSPPAREHRHQTLHVQETGENKFQQKITIGRHHLLADEPVNVGGGDTGLSPYDLLSAALGACTTMTMRMYASHKGYDVGKMAVSVSHAKVHAQDCSDCGEGRIGRIDRFERVIDVGENTDPDIAQKLLRIADKCPVHKTLEHSSVVATRLSSQEHNRVGLSQSNP